MLGLLFYLRAHNKRSADQDRQQAQQIADKQRSGEAENAINDKPEIITHIG